MSKEYNSSLKKTIAILSGIILLGTIIFSAFFIAAEAEHQCEGEECPICECIKKCENIIHSVGGGIEVQGIVFMYILVVTFGFIPFASDNTRETLVTEKVRLND